MKYLTSYSLTEEEVNGFQNNLLEKVTILEQIKKLDLKYDENDFENVVLGLEKVEASKRAWWTNIFRKYQIENIPGCKLKLDPEKKEIIIFFDDEKN